MFEISVIDIWALMITMVGDFFVVIGLVLSLVALVSAALGRGWAYYGLGALGFVILCGGGVLVRPTASVPDGMAIGVSGLSPLLFGLILAATVSFLIAGVAVKTVVNGRL